MLANDMRRLAEEIAAAYEERVRSISELKAETADKLADFRADLENSNRERAKTVQAELKEMGDNLKSNLSDFRSGLADFKADLDDAEKGRKDEAQAEIAERAKHIADLREGTLNLINDFEEARKGMWKNLKSDLEDFTSRLTDFRADLAAAHKERVETIRAELKEMGDRLRSDLKDFMSLLSQFKVDLDQAEKDRKEETLAEVAERRKDLKFVLGGTRDLLKQFGTARQEMWSTLKSQLEAFSAGLAQFKADLDQAEKGRKEEARADISGRVEYIANLREDTLSLIDAFEDARKQMWSNLKSLLEAFTSGLAQFKADLGQAETERQETVGRDLKERADELRASLTGFTTDLSANVAGMIGELRKDRSEAAQAWNQILSTMRAPEAKMVAEPPPKKKAAAKEKSVLDVVEEAPVKAPVKAPVEAPVKPPTKEVITKEKITPAPKVEITTEREPEAVIEEAEDETETLIGEILRLLEKAPDGLRMVELAQILGIENWRSLIPIIRELLDDGDITKENSTYFIA